MIGNLALVWVLYTRVAGIEQPVGKPWQYDAGETRREVVRLVKRSGLPEADKRPLVSTARTAQARTPFQVVTATIEELLLQAGELFDGPLRPPIADQLYAHDLEDYAQVYDALLSMADAVGTYEETARQRGPGAVVDAVVAQNLEDLGNVYEAAAATVSSPVTWVAVALVAALLLFGRR